MSETRCCCNCRRNIRTKSKDGNVRCNCEIDGHYIGLAMISDYELDKHEPRIGVFDEILYALGYRITIEKITEGSEHD